MKVYIGALVAFNLLEDATWFEVLAIDGFTLTIREYGTDFAEQKIDKSLVKQVLSEKR